MQFQRHSEHYSPVSPYAEAEEILYQNEKPREAQDSPHLLTSDRIPTVATTIRRKPLPARQNDVTPIRRKPLPNAAHYTLVDRKDDDGSRFERKLHHNTTASVNTDYNPLFAWRWILVCFATLWVAVIASLQTILSVSDARQALATTENSMRYLWTYGPTAFFVLATILWRQVDYAIKYLQPWAELSGGPLPADKTVLLDYITPLQAIALWNALRFRHWAVASSIVVFVLIKLTTIISTGLFVLENVSFEDQDQPIEITSKFSSDARLNLGSIDAIPAVVAYSAIEFNLDLPDGTTSLLAFQPFEPTGPVPPRTYAYNASVEVFVPDWRCDAAVLTYTNATDPSRNTTSLPGVFGPSLPLTEYPDLAFWNTTISSPDCILVNGRLDALNHSTGDIDPLYSYWGGLFNGTCAGKPSDPDHVHPYPLAFAYSEVVVLDWNASSPSYTRATMLNHSSIICYPSYFIQSAHVSMFLNGTLNGDPVFYGPTRQLSDISNDEVLTSILLALSQSSYISQTEIRSFGDAQIRQDEFVASLIAFEPEFRPEMLLDNNWLAVKSREVFQRNAVQLAKQYIMESATIQSTGIMSRIEARLIVRILPTRIMQITIALMCLLTICMGYLIPQNVIPRDVDSIAAVAAVTARSQRFRQILQNTGHTSQEGLKNLLSGFDFMSVISGDRQFSVRVVSSNRHRSSRPAEAVAIQWQIPIILRRYTIVFIGLCSASILVALEVLLNYSNAHSGITNVSVTDTVHYAWGYVSIIILVLLATAFNLLDFELEFTYPYQQMSRKYACAESSILWVPLRSVAVKNVIRAVQVQRLALVASALATILAPILTIAASGLLSFQQVQKSQTMSLNVSTWFNSSPLDAYSLGSVQAQYFSQPSLILQLNLSNPPWTSDEYVYPSINFIHGSQNENHTVTVPTPALRAYVNCSITPEPSIINATLNVGQGVNNLSSLSFNISTPDGCGNLGMGGDSNYGMSTGYSNIPTTDPAYFGSVGTLLGAYYEKCATFYVLVGRIQNSKVDEALFIQCRTGIEQVQSNATFAPLTGAIIHEDIDDQYINTFLDHYYPTTDAPFFFPMSLNHIDEAFDPFLQTMVYGKDGVPRESLLDRDTLIKQFTGTYRQWMAQWINTQMRVDVMELALNSSNIAGGDLPTTILATDHDSGNLRVFINNVAVRILQGLIGALLVCSIVIFFFVDMSRVLSKSVGTIAAVASLLAGSHFTDEASGLIPQGTEWLSDKEIKEKGLWNNERFKMAWWDDELIQRHGEGFAETNIEEHIEGVGRYGIDCRPHQRVLKSDDSTQT